MPEFVLDHGNAAGRAAFRALDSFAQGYVEAMFFTETGGPDDGDLEDATVADLAPETLETIKADCAAFEAAAAPLLAQAVNCECGYGRYGDHNASECAGHDFWLTRNRHGTSRGSTTSSAGARSTSRLSDFLGWKLSRTDLLSNRTPRLTG